jgi:dimethylargininase
MVLPAANDFPDGCFVEDTAVVLGDTAVITWMGTDSRNGEQQQVAECLQRWVTLVHMRPPASLEGGDVLKVGRDIFVGRSRRTNAAGVSFLREVANSRGFRVFEVPVHHYLHLKTAITCIRGKTFVTANGVGRFIEGVLNDCAFVKLPEECAYAANVLSVGEKILIPDGYPKAAELIQVRWI